MEEIKASVFQLGRDKASGLDGSPLNFYQVFWDTLKEDIGRNFLDLHEGRIFTGPFDYSYICLIPKKKKGIGRQTIFVQLVYSTGYKRLSLRS